MVSFPVLNSQSLLVYPCFASIAQPVVRITAPLAMEDISAKIAKTKQLHLCWHFMPQRCCLVSPSDQRHPPDLRHSLPQLTHHQDLRHLHNQDPLVRRLIVTLGHDFRVVYSSADHINVSVAAALCNCLGLQGVFMGGYHLVDVPSSTPSFLL